MYTVRQLIVSAYRASTVRGIGDNPDADECAIALENLNGALDVLTAKPEFTPSKKVVNASVGSEGYISIGFPKNRVIVTAVADTEKVTVSTMSAHGIVNVAPEGEQPTRDQMAYMVIDGARYNRAIRAIVDPYTFVTDPIDEIAGVYKGQFTLNGEERVSVIDIPPVNIDKVLDKENNVVPEIFEQDFYQQKGKGGKWWFYDKNPSPYKKVWVSGVEDVSLVYLEPCWHDLTLDTDIEPMPGTARQVLKNRLAADIASEAGYETVAVRLEARYRDALNTFIRSNYNPGYAEPDMSAPGYKGGHYDIRTDVGG